MNLFYVRSHKPKKNTSYLFISLSIEITAWRWNARGKDRHIIRTIWYHYVKAPVHVIKKFNKAYQSFYFSGSNILCFSDVESKQTPCRKRFGDAIIKKADNKVGRDFYSMFWYEIYDSPILIILTKRFLKLVWKTDIKRDLKFAFCIGISNFWSKLFSQKIQS